MPSANAPMADVEQYLDNLNFTGGFPRASDLAPSIIFLILYLILLPVVIFRFVHRPSRTMVLIRPAIFVAVRIGTFVLRAVMAKNHFGINELIAELVMVSVGFLFIISPTISLWQRHVSTAVDADQHPVWLARLFKIAQVVLMAAIITAVVGASMTSDATTDSDKADTVKLLRRVSYILSLVVVVVTLLGVLYTHVHFRLAARPTALLTTVSALCFIVAVYRVVQIYSSDAKAPVRSPAAFYVLQAAVEFIAVSLLLAVNLNDVFPEPKDNKTYPPEQPLQYKTEEGHFSNVEYASPQYSRA